MPGPWRRLQQGQRCLPAGSNRTLFGKAGGSTPAVVAGEGGWAMAATDSPRSRRRGRWSRMSSLMTTGRPLYGPDLGGTKPAEGAVPPREVRARTRKVVASGPGQLSCRDRMEGCACALWRPPDRSNRRRTRDTMPLHTRLQPCSGWLALTWAAARAPAEGSAVHGAHPSGCCGLGLAWHAAAVQYGRTRPDGVRVSIQHHHGSGRRGWRRIRICFILLTSSRCLISMRGSGTQAVAAGSP